MRCSASTDMSKLTQKQIEDYFHKHLPYRTRILLCHSRLGALGPWRGDIAVLQACFEASLITGRMYLNMLGIHKNRKDQLVPNQFWPDDVSVEDLGGKFIDIKSLSFSDRELFIGFLKMADKGAAHLTLPYKHPWERTHEAIERIMYYLKVNLYEATNRELAI